jgi:glycosyltransferase involved in cell wall biosynthesis
MPEQPSATANKPVRILALCDSPVIGSQNFVLSTGFGRVARNVLGEWVKKNPLTRIDCYAINFNGWGYENSPVRLFPAGSRWNSPERLNQFLQFLVDGEYTHLWMLMDPDALSVHGFPAALKKVCREHGIRTMLYYPVDAPLEREWLAILDAVDVAVTYTEYGRRETRTALCKSLYPVEVIPHGVDEIFRPLTSEERNEYRKVVVADPANKGKMVDFITPGDFFILNVNKNEWRKDPLRSLEILKGLIERGVPAKLVLRMHPSSAMGGIQIDMAARQLGLTYAKEYIHIADIADENLVGLYNAADLYLTTSMGEGWGLGVTEAMACHCPVAMASHTSLAEIGANAGDRVIWLPKEKSFVCGADTRLRRRVDLDGAVNCIGIAYEAGLCGDGMRVNLDSSLAGWDAVAEKMFHLLMGGAA